MMNNRSATKKNATADSDTVDLSYEHPLIFESQQLELAVPTTALS